MHEVLKPLELEYHDVTLANDQAFARRTHQDTDRDQPRDGDLLARTRR